jgi:hypothetical protein
MAAPKTTTNKPAPKPEAEADAELEQPPAPNGAQPAPTRVDELAAPVVQAIRRAVMPYEGDSDLTLVKVQQALVGLVELAREGLTARNEAVLAGLLETGDA